MLESGRVRETGTELHETRSRTQRGATSMVHEVGDTMGHIHYEFDAGEGEIIEVTLDRAANVQQLDPENYVNPVVRVAPPTELNIYSVYEHRLDLLAQGSRASLMLNFSLFFLGVGATVAGTLWSAPPDQDRVYYTFLIVLLIAFIAGVVLLVLWWFMHVSTQTLIATIKSQMPPNPAVREDTGEVTSGEGG